ncbi:MAG TPA: hypothetical protein VM219_06855 [Phycisphaerae bacterium]|nr:hypothetical protein [Phycisphaerae bacterium]
MSKDVNSPESLVTIGDESLGEQIHSPAESIVAGGREGTGFTSSSLPVDILGPRRPLSDKQRRLKNRILRAIQNNLDGIDAYDLAEAVQSDMGTVSRLCRELEKEAKVARGKNAPKSV